MNDSVILAGGKYICTLEHLLEIILDKIEKYDTIEEWFNRQIGRIDD